MGRQKKRVGRQGKRMGRCMGEEDRQMVEDSGVC